MQSYVKLVCICASLLLMAGCSSRPSSNTVAAYSLKSHSENLYLRGVFNWWEAADGFKFKRIDEDTLSVTISLIADGQPYDFKVADDKWTSNSNCGQAIVSEQIRLSKSVLLVCQENSLNLQFLPASTGDYRFELDLSSAEFPELTVFEVNNN